MHASTHSKPTRPLLTVLAVALASPLGACWGSSVDSNELDLVLTIRNVSAPGALMGSDGMNRDILISTGVWAVHPASDELFLSGQPAISELVELAELGDPIALEAFIHDQDEWDGGYFQVGPGDVDYHADPIGPGDAATVEMTVAPSMRLSVASMFILSNDAFIATRPEGIALDGISMEGVPLDVTDRIALWDAGSEVNEEPGLGASQPLNGAGGEDENGWVTEIDGTDAQGFAYPRVSEFVQVTLER